VESVKIDAFESHDRFEGVNVLGQSALRKLDLSINVDWENETVTLIKN
jgi:hypothetical protein